MEDILASIRRIISDDGAKPGAAPPPVSVPRGEPVIAMPLGPQSDPAVSVEPQPLRVEPLHVEAVAAGAVDVDPGPRLRARRDADDVLELTQVYQPRILPEAEGRPDPAAPLVSPDAAAEVAAALAAIGRAEAHVSGPDLGGLLTGSGRTVDDLVREMLRPMLKEWLDSRLPGLVEAVVREEVERIVRRANLR
ncbi:hypothetical protein EDC65_1689 [Stella humosa]|uniref:DUF2497 domain-containing protein n=2 Tax=Stella humosa TaxID=94 RepID=A0A3N1M864_9PROT|nr:hypothetical protein EDC65_1689 [Stella humosa]